MAATSLITRSLGEEVGLLASALAVAPGERAAMLDVSQNELRQWQAGAAFPSNDVLRRFERLISVTAHLHDTFSRAAGSRWLRDESRYLGGTKPIDALIAGDVERVEAALEALDSGMFIELTSEPNASVRVGCSLESRCRARGFAICSLVRRCPAIP